MADTQTAALLPAGQDTSSQWLTPRQLLYCQLDRTRHHNGRHPDSCFVASWTGHVITMADTQTAALLSDGQDTSSQLATPGHPDSCLICQFHCRFHQGHRDTAAQRSLGRWPINQHWSLLFPKTLLTPEKYHHNNHLPQDSFDTGH